MRVEIYQRRLMEYRRDFFLEFSKRHGDVKVFVEELNEVGEEGIFEKISVRNVAGIKFWSLPGEQRDVIVILPLDFRRPSTMLHLLSRKTRTIIWGHGFGRSKLSVLARPVREAMAKFADASIFYSQKGAKPFIRCLGRERCFVAGNTIVLPEYQPPSRRIRNRFLFFGDIRKEKGVNILIDAFQKVRCELPLIHLDIVGDGPEKLKLQRYVVKEGLSGQIHFYPRTERPEDLKAFLDIALATVSPLHVGLSVVQSFWAHVPVITRYSDSHAPEFEYCVNGENSIVYSGGTSELSDCLLEVTKLDVNERLSQGARTYYQDNLSPENMFNGFQKAVDFVERRGATLRAP